MSAVSGEKQMAKAIGKKTEKRSVRDGLKKAGRALVSLRRRFNDSLTGKYSPRTAALLTAAAVGVIAAVLLLTPQSVGVADDGSLSDVMKRAGLKCRLSDSTCTRRRKVPVCPFSF